MKYPLPPAAYSFNASAGTITFSGTVPADISNIMHITNITRGVLYFQPQAGSSLSGSYSSPTLTLAASTSGHNNADKLLVVYDDSATSVPVTGRSYRSTASITRPSNTTQYTALDVIGVADSVTAANAGSAIHALTAAGPAGGLVLVQSASLIFSDAAVISGMAGFRVHFYSASPASILDNAAFDLVSGDRSLYLGYVDLPTPVDLGSSLYSQIDYPGRMLKLGSGNTTLYAQIQTNGTYTPASASTVELRVNTVEMGV